MPEYEVLVSILSDIHDYHIVSVDVDTLVTNDQFFLDAAIFHDFFVDLKTGVANIELVFQLDQEFSAANVVCVDLKDVEAKLFLILVEQHIELVGIRTVNYVLDAVEVALGLLSPVNVALSLRLVQIDVSSLV